MVEYRLFLYNTNDSTPDLYSRHALDLENKYEDAPEDYFAIKNNAEKIRQDLQFQSNSRITDTHLHQIITTWTDDIKQGYRETTLHLDLLPRQDSDLDNVNEAGNQTIPTLLDPDLNDTPPSVGALPPLNF